MGKIVQIADPPQKVGLTEQAILIAFQGIFAVVPGVTGVLQAGRQASTQWQIFAQVLANAASTAPNVGRFLFPPGSPESQVTLFADMSAKFANITTTVQSNLNKTFNDVMSNVEDFLAFASQGVFSETESINLVDQSDYLYQAFNTYLASEAFRLQDIYAVIGRGTNPQQFKVNGTKVNINIDCDKYNEVGVCDAWWYSKKYNSAFSLNNFNAMNKNYNEAMNNLFQSGLTSGELLFETAYACTFGNDYGNPVNVTVNSTGLQTSCMSQLKMLTWDMGCHNEDKKAGDDCEFLEQESQPSFWYNNMHSVNSQVVFSVPAGYLGPALTRKGVQLKRD